MRRLLCTGCRLEVPLIVVLLCVAIVDRARAQSIDLSLNLFYANPLDDLSGGTWQVAAKSADTAGINGLDLKLAGINVPLPQPVGPRGTVNGSDPAGFSLYTSDEAMGHVIVVSAQLGVIPPLAMGEEQSIFYGVGTIENGQPGDAGPMFTTLTNPQAIPWATGDPFFDEDWNTAAILAAGTFDPGETPDFFSNATIRTTGSVFTDVGTSTTVGPRMTTSNVSTIVRHNLGASPDYNGNGVVDAADYTVWRDSLNQMGPGLPADGNRNGVVDQPDYEFWKLNFGLVIPPGAGSVGVGLGAGSPADSGLSAGSTVPEPASGALLAGALGFLFLRRRFRYLRNVQL